MAELDSRHDPSPGTLTAPAHVKTHPYLQPYLQNTSSLRLQRTIRQTMLHPSIAVARTEVLPNHLHEINLIHLSDGSRLALKAGPSPVALLLRHERCMLDNEALTLQILARSNLPVPRLFKYDRSGTRLGSPFLLTTFLPGTSYAAERTRLSASERADVDNQLRLLMAAIGQHVPSSPRSFGPVALSAANQGHLTWREAFKAMLESVLMDAEDQIVNLPYAQIRDELARCEGSLDDIEEPRLVVMGLCEPRNVLIDRQTNSITGLLDFGMALWGDWHLSAVEQAAGSKGLL